ncbi:PREDICTED: lysophospholipase-like protein 1 [Priapulus caudatus]|uniref:palmitoyl-protein hydrolase n=1 Tax=Priapulus caudatus TaxID=37621 RepID=A0ABM1EZ61_PRICU|nr:PREDICTED: lysophospholipase-like protein 1 [Priapulus caudatus]
MGKPSKRDEPHHAVHGHVTPGLLASLDIPFQPLPDYHEGAVQALEMARKHMIRRKEMTKYLFVASLTGCVIFLHGVCGAGLGMHKAVGKLLSNTLIFSHIRVVFPTAPVGKYTPIGATIRSEDERSIGESSIFLTRLIDAQVTAGIPKHRIIVGGFSMGGSMAMHLAYCYHPNVAGVFSLSSFHSNESTV